MIDDHRSSFDPRRPHDLRKADRRPGANERGQMTRGLPWRGLVLGLAISLSMLGCVVHRLTGPRLTGTCEGACAHYVQCKPGHSDSDRARCLRECPDVFSDRDSLMAYESLSCDHAVEYVDGRAAKTADTADTTKTSSPGAQR